uniref:Reverse transcriptase zinc-binding domain-containing protein n=1 Tax=Tanacetum cinerariifolium TaxID=118510 RepID=A0A6L2J9A7_TANCI|nr:hypothetical protein [Tanacetum cinerariifolium]
MLPSRVLLDIEQIMCGFLWSQDNISRGKVKVPWDVVCLPKQEGGLGIRRLDHFNKALMVSHVWKLLSLKESLWVKHAFNMWLIFKQRLRTQDCLRSWEVNPGLAVVCPLCETQPDSHEHLFFDCPFTQQVWSRVQKIAGLTGAGPSLASIITHLMPIAKRKSSKSCIGKLVVAAAAYFVWHERNSWLFNKVKRSVTEVVDCILSNVRLKLLSCRFKKSRDATLFARLWEIPIMGKGLFGPNGGRGRKVEVGLDNFGGEEIRNYGGNGRRGSSIFGRGGSSLAICLMKSKDGLGGGGLVVVGGSGGEVKGGDIDFGVTKSLLGEILRESGGEGFRVDEGAV